MSAVPPEIYAILALQAIHLVERALYYLYVWMANVKNSSCISSIGKGCLKAEMEIERDTDQELTQKEEGVIEKVIK